MYDREFKVVYASSPWLNLWKLTLADVIGKTPKAFFSPEITRIFANDLQRALNGESVATQRFRENFDGIGSWVENRFSATRAESGEITGVCVYTVDIDWFKRAEQNMAALDAVATAAPSSWAYFGIDGVVRYSNALFALANGKSISQVVGKHWRDVVDSDSTPFIKPAIEKAIAGERNSYTRLRFDPVTQSHRWLNALVSPHVRADTGEILGVFLVAQDVHEIKLIEAELQTAHWRINTHLDQGFMAAIEWDAQGKTLRWSTKATEIFGASPLQRIPNRAAILDVTHPEDRDYAAQKLAPILNSASRSVQFVARAVSVTDELVWCEWHCTSLRDQQGALISVMALAHDITDRVRAEDRMLKLAREDSLTGLPNRLALEAHVVRAIDAARQAQSKVAVLFLDLDRFKLINDTLGHRVGDLLLVAFAQRVRTIVKGHDIIARHGGDEFIVVMSNFSKEAAPLSAGQRVLDALAAPFFVDGRTHHITASIGYALWPDHGATAEALFRRADAAMYRAKAAGRNRVMAYEPHFEQEQQKLVTLEAAFRRALQIGAIEVHFQPSVSIATGQILAVEALARWLDVSLGWVPPGQFIPIAEDSGLIHELGYWVLECACQFANTQPTLRVSVNVSVVQLSASGFVERVRSIINSCACDPGQIEFEITESHEFSTPDLVQVVTDLSEIVGVQIAIDDFGTGYSNLAILRRMPIRTLKVDQSFIVDITENPQSAAIVAATVALGRGLNLRVIAEGVETQAQLAKVKELGCDEYQGFLFGPAVSAAALQARMRAANGSGVA